jgi:hypothetical protein
VAIRMKLLAIQSSSNQIGLKIISNEEI